MSRRKGLNDAARRGELVLWQVLEFFLVIDVVASLVLFARFEKKKQLQQKNSQQKAFILSIFRLASRLF